MPGRPSPLSARSRRTNNYLSSACLLAFLLLPTQGLLAQSTPNWSDWDALLQQYVNDGFVDYRGLRQDSRFPSVVKAIEQADSGAMSNPQKLAYYINAYNILAIQGILNGKSPAGALGRVRYFYRDKYLVAGEKLTLSALENDYIRTLGEPRIHFAIVCASKSCPPLRSQAYTANDLDRQLDDNTRRFLADKSKNDLDKNTGIASISKIFKWFSDDFEAQGGVQNFLAQYTREPDIAAMLRANGFKIKYRDYDWSLNGILD